MRLALLFLGLAVLLLAGCSSYPPLYDGPERPPEELAVLTCGRLSQPAYAGSSLRAAQILTVDGRLFTRDNEYVSRKVDVLPGEHEVEVMFWYVPFQFGNPMKKAKAPAVNVTLEPGYTYAFLGDFGEPTAFKTEYFWNPVSGQPGSSDVGVTDRWTVRLYRIPNGDDEYREGAVVQTWTFPLPEQIKYKP